MTSAISEAMAILEGLPAQDQERVIHIIEAAAYRVRTFEEMKAQGICPAVKFMTLAC